MKLVRAQVQNFRSIVDSEPVDIEDRVTVIVGKNEQGKTTFLRGLLSFNEKYNYSPNDLPQHLRTQLEAKNKADIPIVTLWLVPDVEEGIDLAKIVAGSEQTAQIKVTRYYDQHYLFTSILENGEERSLKFTAPNVDPQILAIKKSAENFFKKLSAHTTRLTSFAEPQKAAEAHVTAFLQSNFGELSQIENLIKTLGTTLAGVPGQDQPIQDDTALMMKEMLAKHDEIRKALQEDSPGRQKHTFPS